MTETDDLRTLEELTPIQVFEGIAARRIEGD